MRSWREPDAGDPHVQFAERRLETELWEGLRHRHEAKAAGNSDSPFPMATAPVVDSTGVAQDRPILFNDANRSQVIV
jgi:hypothetical protein